MGATQEMLVALVVSMAALVARILTATDTGQNSMAEVEAVEVATLTIPIRKKSLSPHTLLRQRRRTLSNWKPRRRAPRRRNLSGSQRRQRMRKQTAKKKRKTSPKRNPRRRSQRKSPRRLLTKESYLHRLKQHQHLLRIFSTC